MAGNASYCSVVYFFCVGTVAGEYPIELVQPRCTQSLDLQDWKIIIT